VLPIENSPPGIQTIPAGGGPAGTPELGAVGAKAIAPTDGQASQAAELSIVFAAGLDRELLTARIVMAVTTINTVARISAARPFRLVTSWFFISPTTMCDPYLEHYHL
jgi:hypothetical protein